MSKGGKGRASVVSSSKRCKVASFKSGSKGSRAAGQQSRWARGSACPEECPLLSELVELEHVEDIGDPNKAFGQVALERAAWKLKV